MAGPNLPDFGDSIINIGSDLQQKVDYGGATPTNPVYIGYARQKAKTSDEDWIIYKCIYDGDNLIWRQRLIGSWDERESLDWQI